MTWRVVLSETVKMGVAECGMTWRVVLSETVKMGGGRVCHDVACCCAFRDSENGCGRVWNDVACCAFRDSENGCGRVCHDVACCCAFRDSENGCGRVWNDVRSSCAFRDVPGSSGGRALRYPEAVQQERQHHQHLGTPGAQLSRYAIQTGGRCCVLQ